jgi:hypothetical protein
MSAVILLDARTSVPFANSIAEALPIDLEGAPIAAFVMRHREPVVYSCAP